jgi:hypothetical protein
MIDKMVDKWLESLREDQKLDIRVVLVVDWLLLAIMIWLAVNVWQIIGIGGHPCAISVTRPIMALGQRRQIHGSDWWCRLHSNDAASRDRDGTSGDRVGGEMEETINLAVARPAAALGPTVDAVRALECQAIRHLPNAIGNRPDARRTEQAGQHGPVCFSAERPGTAGALS